MRKTTIILLTLTPFILNAQIQLSLANRTITNPTTTTEFSELSEMKAQVKAQSTIVKEDYDVAPVVNMTKKGNIVESKEKLNIIDEVVLPIGDAVGSGIEYLNSFFKKDQEKNKVVYNAFNITKDTVYDKSGKLKKKEEHQKLLAVVDNQDEFNKTLKSLVKESTNNSLLYSPVVVEQPKMTVRWEKGGFVPITQTEDSLHKVGKSVVESTFNIDVKEADDDAEWLKTSSFVYEGQVYKKMTLAEYESNEYKTAKVRSSKVYKTKYKNANIQLNLSVVPKQKITSVEQALDLYEDAINAGEKYKIPAAITAAQFILESRAGRSRMAVEINNLFGIKEKGGNCTVRGCNHGVYDDDEKRESFVRYPNYEASFKGHIQFFLSNSNYKKCLECGVDNINCWLYRLQQSGYATARSYDYMLAQIINTYKLTDERIHYNRKEVINRLK